MLRLGENLATYVCWAIEEGGGVHLPCAGDAEEGCGREVVVGWAEEGEVGEVFCGSVIELLAIANRTILLDSYRCIS